VPNAPAEPPTSQHKTLPHALVRAAHIAAAATTSTSDTSTGEETSRLNKSLAFYAAAWEKVSNARLDHDAGIRENFLHPWRTTLNASIAVAMKARNAVKASRLELDAAKQTYVILIIIFKWPFNPVAQAQKRQPCETRASPSWSRECWGRSRSEDRGSYHPNEDRARECMFMYSLFLSLK